MTGGVPTDEQLDRIARGVHRRIDRRRTVARRVVGGVAGTALALGAFALIVPAIGGSSASLSSGSGGGTTSRDESLQGQGASGTDRVPVVCHDAGSKTVRVDAAGLPESAVTACLRAAGSVPAAAGGATKVPDATADWTGVVCRATSGVVHVYAGGTKTCAAHGMTPVPDR